MPLPGKSAIAQPVLTARQFRARAARRALASQGLLEAVTWSFTSQDLAEQFGGGEGNLRLANPISSELDAMRPSALPNLLAAAGRNLDRGAEEFGLFEVGPAYSGVAASDQITEAAGVRVGLAEPRQWSAATRPVDAFDFQADALAALAAAGAPVAKLRVEAGGPAWYHPGRSGTFQLGRKTRWQCLANYTLLFWPPSGSRPQWWPSRFSWTLSRSKNRRREKPRPPNPDTRPRTCRRWNGISRFG